MNEKPQQSEIANSHLEEMPVGKLMRHYSIPCIISLMVAALYNIVDQIFIANAVMMATAAALLQALVWGPESRRRHTGVWAMQLC